MYGGRSEFLAEPACLEGCDPCLRRCAMGRIKLAWWEKEEMRLLRAPAPSVAPGRGAWLSQLAEAAERLQQLRQDTTPFAPSCRGEAFRGEYRAEPPPALLH